MRIDYAAIWRVSKECGAGKFYSESHSYWFFVKEGRMRYYWDFEHRRVRDIVDFWLNGGEAEVPSAVGEGVEMIVEGPIEIDLAETMGWKRLLEYARPVESHERFLFRGDRDFFYAEQRLDGRVANLWEALGYVRRYGEKRFRDFWNQGIYDPEEIMGWQGKLVRPGEAVAWKWAGFSVDDVDEWRDKIPLREALVWRSRGVPKDVALEMHRRGYKADILGDEVVAQNLIIGDIEDAIAILEGAEV